MARPDGEDADLGVVDDRRGEHAAVGADVGDRERAADEPLALDRAVAARRRRRSATASASCTRLSVIGVGDDRHHEAVVGVDRAAEVDHALDEDLRAARRRRWRSASGCARSARHDGGHHERQQAQLAAEDAGVLAALRARAR